MKSAAAQVMPANCVTILSRLSAADTTSGQIVIHQGNACSQQSAGSAMSYPTSWRPEACSIAGSMTPNGFDASANINTSMKTGPIYGNRTSVPVRQTLAPYVVPNFTQKYMMDKRAKFAGTLHEQPFNQIYAQNAAVGVAYYNNSNINGAQFKPPCSPNIAQSLQQHAAYGAQNAVNSSLTAATAGSTVSSMAMSNFGSRVHGQTISAQRVNFHDSSYCVPFSGPGSTAVSRMPMHGSMQNESFRESQMGSSQPNVAVFSRPLDCQYDPQGPSGVWMPGPSNSTTPMSAAPAAADANFPGNPSRMIIVPVPNGTILPMLKLEHNAHTTNLSFNLRSEVFNNIAGRRDIDIELSCFRQESMDMLPSWPEHIAIYLNGIPVEVNRGAAPDCRPRPTLVKSACRAGVNCLQISVAACYCSYLFTVRMVHHSTITGVMRGLITRRLLPVDYCASKLVRYLPTLPYSSTGLSPDGSQREAQLSLKCPLSRRRINIPVRGRCCEHFQCFDLKTYLIAGDERSTWSCPICWKLTPPGNLEVDQYMWGIIRELAATDIDLVIVDSRAAWRPVIINQTRSADVANIDHKSVKTMNKSNTTQPTIQSWSCEQRSTRSTGRPATAHSPLSPESVVLFSPLSIKSEHSVAASPGCPPSTPDQFTYSTSTSATKSPVANNLLDVDHIPPVAARSQLRCSPGQSAHSQMQSSPCFPVSVASTSDTSNRATSVASDQISNLNGFANLATDQRHEGFDAIFNGMQKSRTSPSDPLTLQFDDVLSKEDEKVAIDDILSGDIPDLSDLLPSNSRSSDLTGNGLLPDEDYTSIFS